MLYTRPSFTCPAAGAKTSGENWDRAFLTSEEFIAKYGLGSESEVLGTAHNSPSASSGSSSE